MRQRQHSAIFAGHNPPVSTPPGHAESAVVCLRPLKPRQLQPNEPNSRSTIRRSVGRRFWRLYHPRCFVNHLNRRTCPARRRSRSVEVVRTPVSGVRCLTSKALSCNPGARLSHFLTFLTTRIISTSTLWSTTTSNDVAGPGQ